MWHEEKKLLNKVVIFVFFAHKKYSRSFITLWLNHWCHMDYFNNVLTTFLGLERFSCVPVYVGSESSQAAFTLGINMRSPWSDQADRIVSQSEHGSLHLVTSANFSVWITDRICRSRAILNKSAEDGPSAKSTWSGGFSFENHFQSWDI